MNANVGMYVAPSDVMLEIIETDHLHFRMNVFEKTSKSKSGSGYQFYGARSYKRSVPR
jgi:cobalt-zinc-cadmium efflux system membrane fusion protein